LFFFFSNTSEEKTGRGILNTGTEGVYPAGGALAT